MALDVSSLPIISVGIIALLALLLGGIFTRLGLISSIGYILAGILLGPLGLKLLVPGEGLAQIFGEIGVLMLLFYLGLELSIDKFKKTGAVALVLAFVEMATAFVAGFFVAKLFGFSDLEAIVIGSLLPATSTVIAVRFMMEKGVFAWPEGRIATSALIIEDFFAILVLVLLSSIAAAKSFNVLILNGLLFVVAMFFIVRRLSKYVLGILESMGQQDKMAVYGIGIGIVVSYFGSLMGISSALGAYFAGFAVAETKYAHRIKNELGVFREFFILFFFVSFGATILLPSSVDIFVLLAALLAAYILAKIVAYGVFGTAIGLNTKSAITTGMLMLSIGEFSILIASTAAPLIDHGPLVLSLAFLLTVSTTVSTPILFGRADAITRLFLNLYPPALRKALSIVGTEMKAAEAFSTRFQNVFWNSVKSMLTHFVIALSIAYMALILNVEVLVPAFPNLPSSATLALLILPFIVWPVYRSLQEFKFLAAMAAEHLIGPHAVKPTAQTAAGIFAALAGLLAAAVLYGMHAPPLAFLLPGLYVALAVLFVSQSLWSWIEQVDTTQSILNETPRRSGELSRMSRKFDAEGEMVLRLNEERTLAKEQISEALDAGKAAKARHMLSAFRRREDALLKKLRGSKPRASHAVVRVTERTKRPRKGKKK